MLLLVIPIVLTTLAALAVELHYFLDKTRQPSISLRRPWAIRWHRHAVITAVVMVLTIGLGVAAASYAIREERRRAIGEAARAADAEESREKLDHLIAYSEERHTETREMLESMAELLSRQQDDPASEDIQQEIRTLVEAQQARAEHPNYTWMNGVIVLPIRDLSGTRLTNNFPVDPFRAGPRRVKVSVMGVPEQLAVQIRFQIKADKPVRFDPDRSPVIGHGDVIELGRPSSADRGWYLAARNGSEQFIGSAPDARVVLEIIGEAR